MDFVNVSDVNFFRDKDVISLDFETLGLNDRSIQLFSLGYLDRVNGDCFAGSFTEDIFLANKSWILTKVLVFHNFAFDGKILCEQGVDLFELKAEDSMLAASLLHEGSNSLKVLADEWFGIKMIPWDQVNKADTVEYMRYSALDAAATIRLWWKCFDEIEQQELGEAYKIELKASYAILFMELNGVKLDSEKGADLKIACNQRIAEIQELIMMDAGRVVHLDSTQDLGTYLYDMLNIPFKDFYLTPKGARSTAAKVLDDMAIAIPESDPRRKLVLAITEYRRLRKLVSTYFQTLIDCAALWPDNRVRAHIHQVGVVTGRLSMSGPNFQQLPATPIYPNQPEKHVRAMLIAEPGHKFISADYSQIELRVLAHFSEDPVMIDSYKNDIDYHQQTANLVGCTRQVAKVINFGILFGLGPWGVAQQAGITLSEAKQVLSKYYKTFAGIQPLRRKVVQSVLSLGYIRTLGGRKRRIWWKEPTKPDIGLVERAFMSHLIQGGAAVIMKLGMISCLNAFKNKRVKLLLSIHDELLFECPDEDVEEATVTIKTCMESCIKLNVPLVAVAKVGRNFAECK